MLFNFPAVKFVVENSPGTQLEHFLSEANEVCDAMNLSSPISHIEEEMVDCLHSLETYFRKLEIVKGEDYVKELFDKVLKKNQERGYYQEDGS